MNPSPINPHGAPAALIAIAHDGHTRGLKMAQTKVGAALVALVGNTEGDLYYARIKAGWLGQ